MPRHLVTTILAVVFLFPAFARAQVPPEKALDTFTVADGLELSLFASEPMMVNPTSIDVDHKGRVWVCEAVNYRRKNFGRPILRKEGDRIIVLEDSKGDGKADKVHVFYQSPDIVAPLGICVAPYPDGKGQRVYVCQSPDILVFEDKDGDLKADGPPKKLLSGFNGFDHDHGVHGINIGPDMKLYFTVGDTGVKNLQSSDGKGKVWNSNSTDCRAGTVWRCDMDGKNLELIAHNFRNNYECCVNSFGDIWLSDNDDDGNQQTRICYVMPGGNYGYHPRGPGQSHWHEEQPGIVHKALRTGFGSPTGICFYEGTTLPKKYHGQLIHADAGPREIRCFHIKPKGAGFELEKENLVTSKDSWFRPSDVCVGPDGSIFIADWYDPGVGGHGMGDWTRGRIYRLTAKGQKGYKVPEVKLDTTEGIVQAISSPNSAVRTLASGPFSGLKYDELNKILSTVAADKEKPILLARLLWQAARQNKQWANSSSGYYAQRTNSVPFHVLACRISMMYGDYLGFTVPAVSIGDAKPDFDYTAPAVRREALLWMSHWRTDGTPVDGLFNVAMYKLIKEYDGKDRFYLSAIGISVGADPKRREAILADFEKHFPEWNDKVADLVWELRPPAMIRKMETFLRDTKLTAVQKSRIIDILATSDDVSAGRSMIGLVVGDFPAEVKQRAIDNLKLFLPTKWATLKTSSDLKGAADSLIRSPKTWLLAMDLIAAGGLVEHVERLQGIATKPEDAAARMAAIRTLGQLRSPQAVEALVALTERGGYLLECTEALGMHVIGKADDAASKQALTALLKLLGHSDSKVCFAALNGLAGSQAGTAAVLKLREDKQLPEHLVADAGRLLRNSPYQGLRNKAMVLFPAPGKLDLKKLPAIATLATRRGDVERGKQVFTASAKNDLQCAKCHTIRGAGGFIGPDLSMIGKKASRENLLESMLDPSKAVADQFINWQIETKKGVVLTGLVVEETPEHVILRDANGKDTKLARTDIESKTKNPKSIMPEDIVAHMTEQDLLDLTEYLLTLKTPSLAIPSWNIVGPFDNGEADAGMDKVFPPEKAIDLKATYDGKSGKVTWKTVKPDGTGYVNLQAHYAPNSAQIVSYLYQEIESPADQEATLLIGNDDCCKVWLNGEQVHKDMRHVAATPEMSKVAVKLKKGVNKVLVKINNGDGPHGLYFSVVSEQELKALK